MWELLFFLFEELNQDILCVQESKWVCENVNLLKAQKFVRGHSFIVNLQIISKSMKASKTLRTQECLRTHERMRAQYNFHKSPGVEGLEHLVVTMEEWRSHSWWVSLRLVLPNSFVHYLNTSMSSRTHNQATKKPNFQKPYNCIWNPW